MNIKFDNYDIDLDTLNQDLAESSSTYLDSKRWAKDPEARAKWNQAYNDINSRGITGFSTNNGRYSLSHNGIAFEDPDGYYADAANFIINRAKTLLNTTKKEPENKELEAYDSFSKRLATHILNTNYGNDSALMSRHWNNLDSKDEYGLYETSKRKSALKQALIEYKGTLEDNKYSFEGTSYKNLDDLKSKIDAAIESLNDPNNTNYDALHKLGIDENVWFPTNEEAANEARTAAEEKLAAKNKAKQEQQIALANQKRANQYKTFRFIDISKYNGTPPTGADVQARLNSYYSLPRLNGQQQSELVGAFKYAQKNGLLQNLNRDELSKFGDMYINNPTRLKKIKGVEGFYYDSIGNRIIQPFQGAAPQQDLQDVINESNQQKEQKLQAPRQLSDGWKYEDYARVGAALGDVISLGGFWANVGGSIVSLLGDTTADIADDKVSTWEAVKNFGKNLGWTAAGFISGGKLGKVAEHMLRWGPKILVALNDYNLLNDESNKNTWNKLTSDKLLKEGLNDEDLKNITYWVRALTGTANAVKATGRDIKYSKARGESKQEFTTKDGSKVTLSNKDVKEINQEGATKGQQAAKDLFKSKTGKEVQDNEFSFSESGRKGLFKGTRSKLQDQRLSGKTIIERTPIQQKYYDLLQQDRNKGGWFGWRPFWTRGTSSYFDHFDNGGYKNPLNGLTRKLDPYSQQVKNTQTNSSSSSNINNKSSNETFNAKDPKVNPSLNHGQSKNSEGKIVEPVKNPKPVSYNRETMSRYNDAINGRFGKESLQSGNVKVGGNGDLKIVQQTDGTYNIYFKGNQIGNERNQVEVQKIVSNVIKQLNKKDSQFGKVSAKEMGEILRSLKAKGWLRHGGKLIKI